MCLGNRPSRDRRAEGRNAWLALGYQREFCTATTGFVRKLSGNTLRHNGIHVGIATPPRTLMAGFNDDRGRDGGVPVTTIVCVPGVSGCHSATQPCPADRPCVPASWSKMLSAGRVIFSRGVSASVTGTDLSSTVTVGAVCTSFWRAHVRNAASVVPFPSKRAALD